MGRVLDSLTCILGGYCKRTYDGEPAMRLEPYLEKGEFKPDLFNSILIREGAGVRDYERKGVVILDQLQLYSQLFELNKDRGVTQRNAGDLAHTFIRRIIEGFVIAVCEYAEKKGIRHIGLTGGVAYSLPLIRMVEELVFDRGMELVLNETLPPRDRGISAGQMYAAGMALDKH